MSLSGDPGADEFVVDIDVLYRDEDALDDLLVCRLHPGHGEYGVGISVRCMLSYLQPPNHCANSGVCLFRPGIDRSPTIALGP